jgi:AcrR family transcriptional regulator
LQLIKRTFKLVGMQVPVSKPRASARRGPGRPAGGVADQRERLLDAALRSYAKTGIAAASLRRIASDAGVTPAMVHYYFGSKEQLRAAVVEERVMPVIAVLRERLDAAGNDPRALVTSFVRGVHAAVADNPWLPSLWVREVLSETGALRDLLVTRISPQVPQLLAKRLAAAQKQGDFNADLDPRLLVVSLIGLTLFPFAAAPIWRRIFAATDVDNDALLRHTLALLDHGMGGLNAR